MFLSVTLPRGGPPECYRGGPNGPPVGLMGQALIGPPGPSWARPLWDPWALMGHALAGPLGPCGPRWALMAAPLWPP